MTKVQIMMNKEKLVLAYSGGLDTSYCCHMLSQSGYEVHAVSVNTGGFTKREILENKERALTLGAHTYVSLDATQDYYDQVIRYLIYGNVLRNNTYPLSVSAERIVQAMQIAQYAKEIEATAIAHGSTGAGNDQVRFDGVIQIMAPDIRIITPVRDEQLSRREEIDYLVENGIKYNWEKAKYSINKGLWGTSVGGAETLTSDQSLPEEAYPSQLIDQTPVDITLSFTKGELVALDGDPDSAIRIIEKLNNRASRYAIGRDIHVGDTIIGIKGRVGFEAAGPLIIIKAHHLLEKHTLSKWQLFQKTQLSDLYGMLLHEGQYLDPAMRDMESYLTSSQETVSGDVRVRLSAYRYELLGVSSPHDLMQATFGSYGEENRAWSADEAKGFIKILSNANKIYHQVNNRE